MGALSGPRGVKSTGLWQWGQVYSSFSSLISLRGTKNTLPHSEQTLPASGTEPSSPLPSEVSTRSPLSAA